MNATPSAPSGYATTARTLQIIVASMAIGLLGFGAVALLQQPEPRDNPLTLAMLAVAAAAAVARLVMPPLVVAQAIRSWKQQETPQDNSATKSGESQRLLQVYQTKTILETAVLEGAGFANILAYFLAGHWSSLLAAGLMLVGILASLPSQHAIAHWIERQSRRIREESGFQRRD